MGKISLRERHKAPRGESESHWSLHIGIFQIFLSIIHPKKNEIYSQEGPAGKAEINYRVIYIRKPITD
jgi:hypothetical protein